MITNINEFKQYLNEEFTKSLSELDKDSFIYKVAMYVADHLGLDTAKMLTTAKVKIYDDFNFNVYNTGNTISFYYVEVSDDESELNIAIENGGVKTIKNQIKYN